MQVRGLPCLTVVSEDCRRTMMRGCFLILLLLVVAPWGVGGAPQLRHEPALHEQSHFDVEYEFGMHSIQRPKNVPKDVLRILGSGTRRVLACANAESLSTDQIPQYWFVASEIHLYSSAQTDLIVQPRFDPQTPPSNRCLFGANIGPFWVFRGTNNGHQLIFSADGHDLIVLDSRRVIAISKSVRQPPPRRTPLCIGSTVRVTRSLGHAQSRLNR
jgi:hypothetical protein